MAQGSKTARTLLIAVGVLAVVLGVELGLDKAVSDSSLRQLMMTVACNILVAVSLNVINGMAGQFSIGHAGFVGMGAYTAAIVASNLHVKLGGGDPTFAKSFIVVPVALIASAGMSGLFGFLLGLPSLRLKGDYLAIVTLGFAEIFRLVISTAQSTSETAGVAWGHIGDSYGGASFFSSIGTFFGRFFHAVGVSLGSLGGQLGYQGADGQGVPLYAGPFWILGVTALVCLLAWRLKFSGWGRALRALREDEIAAAAVGVDPTRYKVTSFVIAAVGAGIAGALMGLMRDGTPSVQPDSFNFQASFDAITMVILGGSGSVTGAMLGGVFVTLSIKAIEWVQASSAVQSIRGPYRFGDFEFTLDLNALRMIIYAGVLITLMIMRPEGLLGERELFQKKKKKVDAPPSKPENKPLPEAPEAA